MPFFIPPEFYGLPALGQALGQAAQIGQQGIERRYQKKEREQDDQWEQLVRMMEVAGRSDPAVAQASQQFFGAPITPFVSKEEIAGNRYRELIAKRDAGLITQPEMDELNFSDFGNVLGLSGRRQAEEQQLATGAEGVTQAQQATRAGARTEKVEEQYDATLAAAGRNRGGLMATLDLGRITDQQLDQEVRRVNIDQGRSSILTDQMQRELMRAQIDRLRAEATALAAQANSPVRNKEDAEYFAGLANNMMNDGIIPQGVGSPVDFVARGVQGLLPEDQQKAWNNMFTQYTGLQQSEFKAEIAAAIAKDPNSKEGIAARNLNAYYEAQRNNVPMEVSDDQLAQWQADLTGGNVTQSPGLFGWFKRTILEWAPQEPATVPVSTGEAPPIDPTTVQRTLEGMIQQHGTPEAVARVLAQPADTPAGQQMNAELKTQFSAKYPNVSIGAATTQAPQSISARTPSREIRFEVPPAPEIPQGARMNTRDREGLAALRTRREAKVADARGYISKGQDPPASVQSEISRIDAQIKTLANKYSEIVTEEARLTQKLVELDNDLESAMVTQRRPIERERRRVQAELDSLRARYLER